jgi:amino acid transporter
LKECFQVPALDRAKLLGLVNFGLCPFLYWQNKMPEEPLFNAAVFVLVLSALLFLFNLNVVLKQLGAMLPDSGGQYIYLREAYGPLAAFVCGWVSFLIVQSGSIAAVSVGCGIYLSYLLPGLANAVA